MGWKVCPGPSVQDTTIFWHVALPKMLATAASAASRPVPIRTRPFRCASWVASKTVQLPPMKHSKQAWKSGGSSS